MLCHNRLCGRKRFEGSAMVFSERNRQILPSCSNKQLYITAYVCDVELRLALINRVFSFNIMPLLMLKAVRIPQEVVSPSPLA